MKKQCIMCGELLSDKRGDARFCSLPCKNKYNYQERVGQLKGIVKDGNKENEIDGEKENPLDKSLRGVIENEIKPEQNELPKIDRFKLPFKNPNSNIDADFFNDLLSKKLFNVDNILEQSAENNTTQEPSQKIEQEKEIGTHSEKISDPLKNPLSQKYITKKIKQENSFYKFYKAMLADYEKHNQSLVLEYKKLEAELKDQEGRNGKELIVAGTLGGGLFGYIKTDNKEDNPDGDNKGITLLDKNGNKIPVGSRKKKNKKRSLKKDAPPTFLEKLAKVAFYAAVGSGVGKLAQACTNNWREKDKQKKIMELKKRMQAIIIQQQKNTSLINNTKKIIERTPPYRIIAQKIINPEYEKALSGLNQKVNQSQKLKKDFRQSELIKFKSDKIVKAADIAKIDYKAFCFDALWKDFFGLPSINFHALIHGNSGEGKSTFCMWFARYLAENFGRVLYVSGEEGLNKTFQDKLKYCEAEVEDFYVLDVRTGDELLKEVGQNEFHFIFLDSLHDMDIDAKKLKEIFEKYKNTACICIDQNNKKGELLGANEKKHLVDIVVNVKDYTAETTKNRFKEKGVSFKTADFTGYKKRNKGKAGNEQDFDADSFD